MTQTTATPARAGDTIEVIVHRRQTLADGIAGIELRALDGAPLPAFTAGAHIDVHLPNGLVRQYSLCNDPGESDHYALGILLDPDGRGGSRCVHESLLEGSTLRIGPPRNLFALVPARHSILLAGGIGITPMLAMAAQLTRDDRSFELHYCARTPARMAFRDRLEAAAYASRVRCYFDDAPGPERFAAAAVLSDPDPELHAYVCGPQGFMDYVIGALRARGWREECIHFESFSAPALDAASAGEFEVQIGHGGPVIPIPADRSVAQALAEAGVEIPLSCEQGICGTCALRVLEGTPDHRDMYFTDAEKAANERFTPCCSRSLSPRLVVALDS
ncbi:oxidoreductase [Nitrogeniibacter mangrovi]|uniref:Oxidoreductase n=1 Tax=Nitrogeniibacter mangrovi TaxID=2016596 RepID=A0A6C1B1Z3_9RHOO|nr:PDR/VanB family oxidoreductase [Nitrogeniibacter mangrovi]QID17651.1 oxidoreductase [Nitrogeniibacter mangrovi]